MTLYLEDACYIDPVTCEQTRGHLRVDDGAVGGIAFVDEIPEQTERLACGGRLVTRAFAIAHHHVYSALARGMPPAQPPPQSFVEILERIWWKLDRQLDADMIRASALASAIDAAKSGATFIVDHHSSPSAIAESLSIISDELDSVGLSSLLCYELSDRDGPNAVEQGLAETDRHLGARQGLVGLHASFTVSEALLGRAVEVAQRHGTGLHVHVAEDRADQDQCRADFGQRVIQRFAGAGVLDSPRTLLVHCLHLDDDERTRVAAHPAWVVQNEESNQNNGVGSFDDRGLGDRILIGTDGMHSDAVQSARAAYLRSSSLSPTAAYQRLRRVHDYLAQYDALGDGDNNLVVLDYDSPTPVTADNWPAHVMYGLTRAHVLHVVSSGRVIVRDRRVTTIDEDEIRTYTREQALRLWQRL